MNQNIVENPAVQEQVIVQEIPQVSIEEQIQEQIVASAPKVVVSLPPFEEFDAPRVQPNPSGTDRCWRDHPEHI